MLYNLRPIAAPTLTNLTATPGINQVSLHWDIPVDTTFKSSQVWTNLTNNTVSASLLATVDGNTFVHQSGDTNQRFYWVRAVNIYGRADGAWSNGIQGNGRLITGTDIAPGAVNLSTHVTGLLSAGNVTGLGALAILDRLGIAKIDGLGSLASQSTVNGATQVTNLGTLAYANSLAANQIGAGTLAAGVVYAGVINASQVTAGTFTGLTFRTASSGQRVEISNSSNSLKVYDSLENIVLQVGGSSGNLLATAGLSIPGIRATCSSGATSAIQAIASGGYAVYADSSSSASAAYISNSSSGPGMTVNAGGSAIVIASGSNGILQTGGGTNWLMQLNPASDNGPALGTASFRWSQVYAASGAISTSDAREKQQERVLSDAEQAVAQRLKGLLRMYKFNAAVANKGDAARWHIGVIAQEVKAAFEAEGLVAEQYGVLCHDIWEAAPELQDDKGNIERPALPAGDRYGVRYEELLAFIIAAL